MGHVPHVFVPGPWLGDELPLQPEQAHHLRRVLRMPPGDEISYTDGEGQVGRGRLGHSGIEREVEEAAPSPPAVEVAVAPPASRSRARFLVEKLAELGVRRLIWVRTRHAQGRPPADDKARAWAVAALEQSRGAWLLRFARSDLADLDAARLVVVHPGPDPFSLSGDAARPPVLVVGPEGGLADDEIPPAAARLSLGSTILRVETATVAATVAWYALHPDTHPH